jgi:Flp pilus assembly protein TadB
MGAVSLAAAFCAALAAVVGLGPRPGVARLGRLRSTWAPDRVGRGGVGRGGIAAGSAGPAGAVGGDGPPSNRRGRLLAALGAGAGGAVFLGGALGLIAGAGMGVLAWVWVGRLEPAAVAKNRERIVATVPLAAELLAAALAAGCPPGPAAEAVGRAIPGPLGARLMSVSAVIRVGADPIDAWDRFAAEPALRALGRVMAGAASRGTSPVPALERIARDADDVARWAAESRARSVGAKAAVPLGLCFLPAFVLVGIVPVIATSITLLR